MFSSSFALYSVPMGQLLKLVVICVVDRSLCLAGVRAMWQPLANKVEIVLHFQGVGHCLPLGEQNCLLLTFEVLPACWR